MRTESFFEEELNRLEFEGLKRSLSNGSAFQGLNFSSNDYLGLSRHPEVMRSAVEAIQKYGTGGTSSRLLAGTNSLHLALEQSLADFLEKPAALVFSSGYHTNTGLIPVVAQAGDFIVADRLCHASIMDGIRLSEARFATFAHNDGSDLEHILASRRSKYRRTVVITEGVFSMDGDTPPLTDLIRIAHAYEALVYIDEAHSFGLMGPAGRGVSAQNQVLDQVDIFVGTLSKTLGSQGGFVATSRSLVELLVSKSRSFIYTTSLAPAAVGAATAALALLPQLEERREKIRHASRTIRTDLQGLGFQTGLSQSHIIPVMTGDIDSTQNLSAHLFKHGFFVPSIRPPTVAVGEGRVRLSITYPVMERGWASLIEAFSSYPHRSPRTIHPNVKVR